MRSMLRIECISIRIFKRTEIVITALLNFRQATLLLHHNKISPRECGYVAGGTVTVDNLLFRRLVGVGIPRG